MVAVAAVLIGQRTPWGHPQWWMLLAMAVAVGLCHSYPARIVIGRQVLTFALADAFIAVGLVVRPGTWLALAFIVGYLGARGSRLNMTKLTFNVATFGLAGVLAAAITTGLGGGIAPALAGVLAFFAVNYLLIMLAISVASARRFFVVVRESVILNLLHEGGNASLGLLAAWLFVQHEPAGLLGLVVPIGLLWWSYAQQAQRAAEARLFEELAHGQEKVLATSVDTSAQVIVTAAARTFGGAEVELLLRHPDGLIRYIGDENGLLDRSRVEPEAFGSSWVLQALGNRGVQTGTEQGRPYCSAVLGDADRPLAVLIARRPEGRTEFSRADAQLAAVLIAQAESWLSVADLTAQAHEVRGEVEAYRAVGRVLGDIGADTVPALVVLRESADRLSRLANRFAGPDPVKEIVEELHAVERAVASLLGAVVMAQPVHEAGAGAARVESAWTTTGRLESADVR